MIGCGEALDLLALRATQEAEPATVAALDAHLAACRACAAEAERIHAVLAVMREDPAGDPGPAYWTTFQARLDARIGRRRRAVRVRATLGIAAALIAAVGLGRMVTQDRGARQAGLSPSAVGDALAQDGGAEARFEAALAGLARDPAAAEAEAAAILESILPAHPLALEDDVFREPAGGEQGGGRAPQANPKGPAGSAFLSKANLRWEAA